jgi:hypothetical protein
MGFLETFFGMSFLFFSFIFLLILLLPILALIDIVRSDFEGNNKLMWALIVVFMNIVGTILYFVIGRAQKIEK